MHNHRFVVKVAGESGQGINSIGEVLAKALKETGFYTFGYREYPSLIKGGYACHQTDFSDQPLQASSQWCDLLVCFSRVSIHAYLPTLRPGGQLLHMLRAVKFSEAEEQLIAERQIKVAYVEAEKIALAAGGKAIMANTVLVGMMWQLLGLEVEYVQEVLRATFAHKPEVIESNLSCLQAGYATPLPELKAVQLPFEVSKQRGNDGLLTGNHLITLGAIGAGVRAYFAYPMTPSSSILTYMADWYHETGILVKQVEDEISVAQMGIGAMFAGTRALVATSGGGFDLMTESLSMAAITETPFVCVLAQRPGPATGLPTWTSAADLNLALYAGHGEYARCVISVSDPASCYSLIQRAFNLAEKYQIPVIVLTDKQIAESLFQVPELPEDLPIERHLVPKEQLPSLRATDRFKITETGISPRWLPGQAEAMFDANSDEHTEDGSITEEAGPSEAMYSKRLRKEQTLLLELPEPELIGPPEARLTFIGWGSVRTTLQDVMQIWNREHPDQAFNYLHYEYLWPLKTERFQHFVNSQQRVVLIENNALGQLGNLLRQHTGYELKERLLKYDGRPFFIEDVLEFLQNNTNQERTAQGDAQLSLSRRSLSDQVRRLFLK